VPGLLTPLGVFGWLLAGVLALLLIAAMRGESGRRRKVDEAQLSETYGHILAAARFAVRQDEFGILRGADVLRRVIKTHLGGVLLADDGLGKQLKKLGEAMGEKDEKKDDKKDGKKKKKDDHGAGGHGGHGKHEAHPVAAEHSPGSTTTVAETVHGHSITLNIGNEKPGHGGHGGHGDDHGGGHGHDDHDEEEEKPPTLEEQLLLVRKAVREFEAWWSDKPARMAELRAAHDDLTSPKKPDPALAALLEERK
ncbi:MAG: hypothetical protein ACOVMO_03795, partial [Caulobacter sp.]